MFDGQMEMSFGKIARRQRQQSRAQWWFQRMRQIVDRATDWQPVPPPRPVQIWFASEQERFARNIAVRHLHRRAKTTEERQICE